MPGMPVLQIILKTVPGNYLEHCETDLRVPFLRRTYDQKYLKKGNARDTKSKLAKEHKGTRDLFSLIFPALLTTFILLLY